MLAAAPARDPGPAREAARQQRGQARIVFARDPSGRTYIRSQRVAYPYHLCRALSFEQDPAGMATVYLQSCAGGIYEDDRLAETIVAEAGACAHVTTQAATIVHSMQAGLARQRVVLEAEAGSLLEYLPDPLILFPHARIATDILIRAHDCATVIAGESFLCHDPRGRGAMFDWIDGRMRMMTQDGALLASDRFALSGALLAAGLPGIAGRYRAQGSLFVIGRVQPAPALVEALRAALAGTTACYAGASELPAGCGAWMRLLAGDASSLRAAMIRGWQSLRALLTGSMPRPRRK